MKKFFVLIFCCFCSFSYAQQSCVKFFYPPLGEGVLFDSLGAVCSAVFEYQKGLASNRDSIVTYKGNSFLEGKWYNCNFQRKSTLYDFIPSTDFSVSVHTKSCGSESGDKCVAKQGKLTWQYVPVGKIKITNLDKGTYDFKRVPPPPKVCFEDCEAGSPGKYIGVLGMRGVDLENTDSNGYHTTFSNIEYTFTGNLCVEGEHNIPGKPPEKLPENDEEKCKGKGGYFGQVNGKDVCLGVDDQNKCLPGQTYGQINGKDVCLTPEGEKLPVPEPGDSNQPGNGSGNGNGGNGNGGNGQGNGSGGNGSGSGGGSGAGHGIGQGDGEGEGEDECSKNPDRLGCMKAGDPQKGQPLGKSDKSLTFEKQDVPLPTNGCPAPRNLSVSGMKFRVDLEPLCKAADIARPFVLLLANFSAVFIATLGIKRNKGL